MFSSLFFLLSDYVETEVGAVLEGHLDLSCSSSSLRIRASPACVVLSKSQLLVLLHSRVLDLVGKTLFLSMLKTNFILQTPEPK